MRITYQNEPTPIDFEDIEVGDVFESEGHLFLKTGEYSNDKTNNSFNLTNKTSVVFNRFDSVILHDTELYVFN